MALITSFLYIGNCVTDKRDLLSDPDFNNLVDGLLSGSNLLDGLIRRSPSGELFSSPGILFFDVGYLTRVSS